MSEFKELHLAPHEFNGVARLFPLPGTVLFPHVMQPLHIFEPRYREMVASAMATDRAIAIASFEPGWETEYEGRPPLKPMACLGHIAACAEQEDGCYNILLLGRQRVELVEELPPLRSFREARCHFVEDEYPAHADDDRERLHHELIDAFRSVLPHVPQVLEQLDELLKRSVPLGMLTDIFAYTLEIDLAAKQRLLAELDVDRRSAVLLDELAKFENQPKGSAKAGNFPPQFSVN